MGGSTDSQRQEQVIPGLTGHFTTLSFTLNREWGALNRSDNDQMWAVWLGADGGQSDGGRLQSRR